MSLLRAGVLGGVDGVITSFTVVAGSHAGGLSARVVLVVGTASVLADGLSMGVSEYLSSDAARADRRHRGEPLLRESHPLVLGATCLASFVTCGAVPIAVFLAANASLLSCAMFALVELMLLGAARTRSTGEPLLWGLGQTALLGAATGGVAYGVGAAASAI